MFPLLALRQDERVRAGLLWLKTGISGRFFEAAINLPVSQNEGNV
jgi:hypothetical protein